MKILIAPLFAIVIFAQVAQAQSQKLITFDQIFTTEQQKAMGLSKLTESEKEALRAHVEAMLVKVLSAKTQQTNQPKDVIASAKVYAGASGGHWIKKNVDRGTYMVLEDGSLWQIDPLDKIDAMLWLPISNITVVESSKGSPGFGYLLINTDDGEKAHAKYLRKQ